MACQRPLLRRPTAPRLCTHRHTHSDTPTRTPPRPLTRARMQKPEPVFVTAGIEQPTDLTAHMTAGIVSSTLALHRYGRLSRVEALRNIDGVKGLYNVTVDTAGVLKHYRSLWRSDSFYDDKLWAVRCCMPLLTDAVIQAQDLEPLYGISDRHLKSAHRNNPRRSQRCIGACRAGLGLRCPSVSTLYMLFVSPWCTINGVRYIWVIRMHCVLGATVR